MSDTTRIQTHEHHKPCPVTQIKTEPNDEDANALAILLGVRYDPEPQAHSSGFYQSSCQVDDEEDDVVFEEKFPIDINRVPVTNRLQNVVEKDAKVPLPSPSKKKKAQKRKSEEHSSELFELERIISFYHYTDTDTYYLCKWVGYPYTQCTWEKFPEHEKKDVRTVVSVLLKSYLFLLIIQIYCFSKMRSVNEWCCVPFFVNVHLKTTRREESGWKNTRTRSITPESTIQQNSTSPRPPSVYLNSPVPTVILQLTSPFLCLSNNGSTRSTPSTLLLELPPFTLKTGQMMKPGRRTSLFLCFT